MNKSKPYDGPPKSFMLLATFQILNNSLIVCTCGSLIQVTGKDLVELLNQYINDDSDGDQLSLNIGSLSFRKFRLIMWADLENGSNYHHYFISQNSYSLIGEYSFSQKVKFIYSISPFIIARVSKAKTFFFFSLLFHNSQ